MDLYMLIFNKKGPRWTKTKSTIKLLFVLVLNQQNLMFSDQYKSPRVHSWMSSMVFFPRRPQIFKQTQKIKKICHFPRTSKFEPRTKKVASIHPKVAKFVFFPPYVDQWRLEDFFTDRNYHWFYTTNINSFENVKKYKFHAYQLQVTIFREMKYVWVP